MECIHHSHYDKPEECASLCEYAGDDAEITRLVGQPCVPLPVFNVTKVLHNKVGDESACAQQRST